VLKNLGNQKDIKQAELKERFGDWTDANKDPKSRADAAYNMACVLNSIKGLNARDGSDRYRTDCTCQSAVSHKGRRRWPGSESAGFTGASLTGKSSRRRGQIAGNNACSRQRLSALPPVVKSPAGSQHSMRIPFARRRNQIFSSAGSGMAPAQISATKINSCARCSQLKSLMASTIGSGATSSPDTPSVWCQHEACWRR